MTRAAAAAEIRILRTGLSEETIIDPSFVDVMARTQVTSGTRRYPHAHVEAV